MQRQGRLCDLRNPAQLLMGQNQNFNSVSLILRHACNHIRLHLVILAIVFKFLTSLSKYSCVSHLVSTDQYLRSHLKYPDGFLLQGMEYSFFKLNAQLCLILCDPHGLQLARLLCPWDFLTRNSGVGCHFLLWEIFPTQGSNCIGRQILYH